MNKPESEIMRELALYITQTDPWQSRILYQSVNYWIIDLNKDSLMGPYSMKEYLDTKKAFRVNESLKLSIEK